MADELKMAESIVFLFFLVLLEGGAIVVLAHRLRALRVDRDLWKRIVDNRSAPTREAGPTTWDSVPTPRGSLSGGGVQMFNTLNLPQTTCPHLEF